MAVPQLVAVIKMLKEKSVTEDKCVLRIQTENKILKKRLALLIVHSSLLLSPFLTYMK